VIEYFIFSQLLQLSPSQWAAYFPAPGNMDRDRTMLRFPVATRAALEETEICINIGEEYNLTLAVIDERINGADGSMSIRQRSTNQLS
jgi:hypothetical protein